MSRAFGGSPGFQGEQSHPEKFKGELKYFDCQWGGGGGGGENSFKYFGSVGGGGGGGGGGGRNHLNTTEHYGGSGKFHCDTTKSLQHPSRSLEIVLIEKKEKKHKAIQMLYSLLIT